MVTVQLKVILCCVCRHIYICIQRDGELVWYYVLLIKASMSVESVKYCNSQPTVYCTFRSSLCFVGSHVFVDFSNSVQTSFLFAHTYGFHIFSFPCFVSGVSIMELPNWKFVLWSDVSIFNSQFSNPI